MRDRNIAQIIQAAIIMGACLVAMPVAGQVTEQSGQRRDARDTRQDTRQDSRSEKVDCRQENQKNNAECRQDKRGSKQEGREKARDIKY